MRPIFHLQPLIGGRASQVYTFLETQIFFDKVFLETQIQDAKCVSATRSNFKGMKASRIANIINDLI